MVIYRRANFEDNRGLLELTSEAGMDGDISLRIDRHPNFFELLELRGETAVFVAKENDKIIGSLCVSTQDVYINQKIYPVKYIGDFKVALSARNRGIGLELTNTVAKWLMENDADLVFLNVSKGNTRPFSFFTDRSVGTDFENIGDFYIYQLIGKKPKKAYSSYNIKLSSPSDDVINLFNRVYQKYELGTVIDEKKLQGTDVITVHSDGKLVAAMSLIDTMSLKQNVVTRISLGTNLALKAINQFSGILGFSKMPALNHPVKMIYIKYLAADTKNKELISALLDYARGVVYDKDYSFVSIGLHERDPLREAIKNRFKFTFKSVGMLSSIKQSRNLLGYIQSGVPFEDYSIV